MPISGPRPDALSVAKPEANVDPATVAFEEERQPDSAHTRYIQRLAAGVKPNRWRAAAGAHSAVDALAQQLRLRTSIEQAESNLASGRFITESSAGDPKEAAPYWQQADAALNSAEAIQQRFKLRTHTRVTESLEAFWRAGLRSMHRRSTSTGGQAVRGDTLTSESAEQVSLGGGGVSRGASHLETPPGFDRANYSCLFKRIYRALMEVWDEEDAEACIEEDWMHDTRGGNTLSRALCYLVAISP